jgi:acyl dehydratase
VKQLYFDDFALGDRFEGPSRTLTEAHFFAFAGLTGDSHPIHYDVTYAAAHGFGGRVAHGLLLASLTAVGGTELSGALLDSMIAFMEQSTNFRKPAFIGDTVTPVIEVSELIPKQERGVLKCRVSLVNQDGDEVLDGEHVYLLKRHAP